MPGILSCSLNSNTIYKFLCGRPVFPDYLSISYDYVGSKTFKESYIKEFVSKWCEELTKLSEIAKTQPHTAYATLTPGNKYKFSYFMQTINCISSFMSPVEKTIKEKLIPALFDGFRISEEFR